MIEAFLVIGIIVFSAGVVYGEKRANRFRRNP